MSDAVADPLSELRAIGPVDCDLHPAPPAMAELLPYLDAHWREQITTRGIDELDLVSCPPRAPLSCRPDWRNEAGIAAPNAATLARHALDPYRSRLGVLNCLHGSIAMYSEDMGAALASAVNDWLAEHWLDRDPRLRASVTVCMRDPALAAAEIDRRADDRRFVQVLLLVSGDMPLGRRPRLVSPNSVNWLITSRPPATSARARFILPFWSAKTRRPSTLSATKSASAGPSSLPMQRKTARPRSIFPTVWPPTSTRAAVTRCTTARIRSPSPCAGRW